MSLAICSFSSGSSGNSYLIKNGTDAILIDAGISATRILHELTRTGTARENIRALFLTHEHWDHTTGARVLLKKLPQAQVYASEGTLAELCEGGAGIPLSFAADVAPPRRKVIAPERPVRVGNLTVRAFHTLHDAAEPLGFSVESEGKSIAIVTDTGVVTEEILFAAEDADVLVLESNHDVDILRNGSYPWPLKQRILGEHGHLSNVQAAQALCRVFADNPKRRVVLLAHLSAENNTPRVAEQTVCALLAREGWFTGSNLYVGVLLRDTASLLYTL
ncbi:MAG: MBL fold metallo-hydrolase [Clostridiales bacterium]|nr:MBL fold metallo-hydrolase [Clostridiales bacterium]